MKRMLLTLGLACSFLFPLATHAYMYDQFKLKNPFQKQQYVPNPMSWTLPGWPDWIGRLDAIAGFYYGKRYVQLDENQKAIVRQLSKEWPDWIGVPPWLTN